MKVEYCRQVEPLIGQREIFKFADDRFGERSYRGVDAEDWLNLSDHLQLGPFIDLRPNRCRADLLATDTGNRKADARDASMQLVGLHGSIRAGVSKVFGPVSRMTISVGRTFTLCRWRREESDGAGIEVQRVGKR